MKVVVEMTFVLSVVVTVMVSLGHLVVTVELMVEVRGFGVGTREEQAALMVAAGQLQSWEGVGAHW